MRVVVQVKPGSTKGPLVESGPDGTLIVYVREKAIDGKANDGVIKALSNHFDVPKSAITVVRGLTSRIKHVVIYT